ncbi:MAG: NUDIX domain-containing protein [Caldilineaceae bacterium]
MLPKVVAYITRDTSQDLALLVFRHPHHIDVPIQVPQGTVEQGESVINALWRELLEETGRTNYTLVCQLAKEPFYADWRDEWQERNVYHLMAPIDIQDHWTHIVTDGGSDKGLCFEFFWLPLTEAKAKLHWSQNQWLGLLE